MFFFKKKFDIASVESIVKQEDFENSEYKKYFINSGRSHYLNPLPVGNNLNYKKFIIIGHQRCGSTYLVNLLRSHPQIVCYGEIFYNTFVYWKKHSFSENEINYFKKYPLTYIYKYIYRNYSDNVKAVGFKIMFGQLKYKKINKIINSLKPDGVIIHIRRDNLLESYVSLKIRERFPVAILKVDDNVDEKIDHFYVDYSECLNYFYEIRTYNKKIHKLVSKSELTSINIEYNDLVKDMEKVLTKIQVALNLDYYPVISITKKINNKSPKEIIVNYDELKNKFKNTEFEKYFS